MKYLLTAAQMRAADQYTSEVTGIPSIVLMERAALAVVQAVEEDFPCLTNAQNEDPNPLPVWQVAQTNPIYPQICPAYPARSAGTVRVCVLAGSGSNGADGIAAGRILLGRGCQVRVFLTGHKPGSASLCQKQLDILEQYGGEVCSFSTQALLSWRPDVIIDAITGIGLREDTGSAGSPVEDKSPAGSLVEDRSPAGSPGGSESSAGSPGGSKPHTGGHFPAAAVYAATSLQRLQHTRIYAVDMPSGILADSGRLAGECAIHADRTITFGFAKRGQLLYPGTEYCGKLTAAEIGIAPCGWKALPGMQAEGTTAKSDGSHLMFTYDTETAADLLPRRLPAGNKGSFGKVLIIAGSRNMCGAALLCARACARSGAGMVKVFTEECNRQIIQIAAPELLLGTYDSADVQTEKGRRQLFDNLSESLSWADTVIIGPGLGRGEAAQYLTAFTLSWLAGMNGGQRSATHYKGLVIDADAVRIIGKGEELAALAGRIGEKMPVVFTPHMAECAALLGVATQTLQANTIPMIKDYADAHHCCILCKDARSMAVSWKEERVYLNTSGNDGLSTAGSGDVLSGITGAFLGQGMTGFAAACAASYLHGRAAQFMTEQAAGQKAEGITNQAAPIRNTRSLVAGDLIDALKYILMISQE